jgi:hypothetical protein
MFVFVAVLQLNQKQSNTDIFSAQFWMAPTSLANFVAQLQLSPKIVTKIF